MSTQQLKSTRRKSNCTLNAPQRIRMADGSGDSRLSLPWVAVEHHSNCNPAKRKKIWSSAFKPQFAWATAANSHGSLLYQQHLTYFQVMSCCRQSVGYNENRTNNEHDC